MVSKAGQKTIRTTNVVPIGKDKGAYKRYIQRQLLLLKFQEKIDAKRLKND